MNTNKVYYIEFNISGVLKIDEKSKQELVEKLQLTISDFISQNSSELVRVDSSVDVVAEEDIISVMSGTGSEFN
jgi:hypothetical protein